MNSRFCSQCGKPIGSTPWYYRPLWIMVLALFVLGPFALPLVWKSPAISRPAKIWITVGITVYSLLLVYWTWVLTVRIYHQMQQVMDALELM